MAMEMTRKSYRHIVITWRIGIGDVGAVQDGIENRMIRSVASPSIQQFNRHDAI